MYIDPKVGMPQGPLNEDVVDAPFFMRAMDAIPGMSTGIGFQAGRGARTIMAGGGFMDDARFGVNRKAQKYSAFRKGSMIIDPADMTTGRQYANFGRRSNRGARLAGLGTKQPFVFGGSVNTITARPRALRRASSLSVFSNDTRAYTYAQGTKNFLSKQRFGPLKSLAEASGAAPGEAMLGPGLFSAITAGRKMDLLERKALRGNAGALSKLSGSDIGIQRMAGMNNSMMVARGGTTPVALARSLAPFPGGAGVLPASERLRIAREVIATSSTPIEEGLGKAVAGKGVGEVGVRGNLLASAMAGKGTRYMAGYFRGAQGFASTAGLSGEALSGATKAVGHMTTALGEGIVGRGGATIAGELGAKKVLEQGVLKTLGPKGTMTALGTKTGAAVLGARGLAFAVPGLNLLATAALVYDLGRLGGEGIKSGINLIRDAGKSLQGSLSKPAFGMGYRDTEAASTSRSRGVMAIQNSRLNARSALGSEASMMAAHFG